MGLAVNYIEFSEDLSRRVTGNSAILDRIQYRLATIAGEIPYDTASLQSYLFTRGREHELLDAVRRRIADITDDVRLTKDGRVVTLNSVVKLPTNGGN